MKIITISLFAALVGLGIFLAPAKAECASCGITPIKPIVPIGCKDLAPVCVTNGTSAYWTWICVK